MDDRLEKYAKNNLRLLINDIHEAWACYLVVNIINWVNSR